MLKGYIYKIYNDLNDKVYIGQTVRDVAVRFNEHCFDKRATSKIHKAISELGYLHFKYEILEECSNVADLNERESFWVNEYNAYVTGYNSTPNGQWSTTPSKKDFDHIFIKGPNLIFESKTECARILEEVTCWGETFLRTKLNDALQEQKLFLDEYEVFYTTNPEVSSIDDIEDWAKFLAVQYCGKKIRLVELQKDFDTITSAAVWLLTNNYFTGFSKTPLQSLITSISKAIKTGQPTVLGSNFHFEELPGSVKNPVPENSFESVPIFCDQLQVEFPSSKQAAQYFVDHKLWGNIKLKTATCRISDVLRGYYREYKGYTFKLKTADGNYQEPVLLQIQLPFMNTKVPIDWVATDEDLENVKQYLNKN